MKLLSAGKHHVFRDSTIEVVALDTILTSGKCSLDTLLDNMEIAKQTSAVEMANQQLALHFINGKFAHALRKGKYAFWTIQQTHTYYLRAEVVQYQKGRLYLNRKLERLLEPGT